jgi:hypothetical protein
MLGDLYQVDDQVLVFSLNSFNTLYLFSRMPRHSPHPMKKLVTQFSGNYDDNNVIYVIQLGNYETYVIILLPTKTLEVVVKGPPLWSTGLTDIDINRKAEDMIE